MSRLNVKADQGFERFYSCLCASDNGKFRNESFPFHSRTRCGESFSGTNSGLKLCFCSKHSNKVSHSAYVSSSPHAQKSLRQAVGNYDRVFEPYAEISRETAITKESYIYDQITGSYYALETTKSASAKDYKTALSERDKKHSYVDLYWKYVKMPTDDMNATDNMLRALIDSVTLKTEHIVDKPENQVVRKPAKKVDFFLIMIGLYIIYTMVMIFIR